MKLKPCPFCGAAQEGLVEYASDGDLVSVVCQCCSAQGPFILPDGKESTTEAKARSAWNKRAQEGRP